MGTSCNGTQFSSPLYEFPVAERTTGIVGQVELRSTDNAAYTLSISSCSPPSMTGSLNMRHFFFNLPDRIISVKFKAREKQIYLLYFLDYFAVERNGSIVVISPFNWTNNRTRIILTISAENQRHSNRMMSISTIVNIDVLDINEAPQFLDYGSSVVIGYPDRTYFDPSVQMPLFTVKVPQWWNPLVLSLNFICYFQTLGQWCWQRRKCYFDLSRDERIWCLRHRFADRFFVCQRPRSIKLGNKPHCSNRRQG